MPIDEGCVVISKAGHDVGELFVVVSVRDGFVELADGKRRPLERTKHKSVRHIRKTNTQLDFSSIKTNKKLREALRALKQE